MPIVVACNPGQLVSEPDRLIVYSVSTVTNFFYLYTLYHVFTKAKSKLLIFMIFIFMMVNVAACTWQYYYHMYNKQACQYPDSFDASNS